MKLMSHFSEKELNEFKKSPMFRYLKEKLNGFSPNKILDIGAWNGRWTRQAKQFWPDAHYTCIEAGEKHKERLKECANNVFIGVLGNENKKVKMHLRKITKGSHRSKITYTKGSNIFGSSESFPSHSTEVREMVTLESLVGADVSYDFIKQDVQGAELLVIQGSPEIFKRATYVLNEVNVYKDPTHPLMPDVKEMDTYMKNLGFLNSKIIDDHGLHKQVDKIYWK